MCAHIIGRYWRMGFYNKAPFYIQEKQPQQDDKEQLMLLVTDGNWWLVQPGYGKKETVYLAQSDWPARMHMMEGDATNNYDLLNVAELLWNAPYDGQQPFPIVCLHGQSWLYDRMNAELATEIERMHVLLDEKANEAAAVKAEATAEASGRPKPQAYTVDLTDEDCEDQGDYDGNWDRPPKAGSLNHKCALITAYKRQNWQRVDHLIKVLLACGY